MDDDLVTIKIDFFNTVCLDIVALIFVDLSNMASHVMLFSHKLIRSVFESCFFDLFLDVMPLIFSLTHWG